LPEYIPEKEVNTAPGANNNAKNEIMIQRIEIRLKTENMVSGRYNSEIRNAVKNINNCKNVSVLEKLGQFDQKLELKHQIKTNTNGHDFRSLTPDVLMFLKLNKSNNSTDNSHMARLPTKLKNIIAVIAYK
jgi:hypothetical protein